MTHRNVSWVRLVVASVVSALLIAGGVLVKPAQAYVRTDTVATTAFDARLVALINAARTSRGLQPVTVSAGLWQAAQARSAVNAAGRQLVHDPALGANATAAGCRWRMIGEDIALASGASATADRVFAMYRNSPRHWAVILEPTFTAIGSGTVDRSGSGSRAVWNTLKFATGCSTGNVPAAVWGLAAERVTVPRAGSYALLGRDVAADPRTQSVAWGSGLRAATGRGGFAVSASSTAIGNAGLLVRQGLDLRAARSLRMTIRGSAPVKLTVLLYDGWSTRRAGVQVVAGASARTVTLPLPAAARTFANHVSVTVDSASIRRLGGRVSVAVSDVRLQG